MESSGTNWEFSPEPTQKTLVAEIEEEIPTLAAGTIACVVLFILAAIAVLFALGVLLDCRQQKILEKRLKMVRPRRRAADDLESEDVVIVTDMEPSARSAPPAESGVSRVAS